MKKAISVSAYGAERPLSECLKITGQAGFDGLELLYGLEGDVNPRSTAEAMSRIAGMARDEGVEISGLSTALHQTINLIGEDAAEREQFRGHAMRMLELGSALGIDCILLVPGIVGRAEEVSPRVPDYAAAYDRCVAELTILAQHAAACRVAIGLENVPSKFLLSPLELNNLIDAVGSPWVGAYFDVGNIMPVGYPEMWIRALGPRLRRVHFKDYRLSVAGQRGSAELLAGDVNWPAVMTALRDVGYDGYCTAELGPRRWLADSIVHRTAQDMDLIFGLS